MLADTVANHCFNVHHFAGKTVVSAGAAQDTIDLLLLPATASLVSRGINLFFT